MTTLRKAAQQALKALQEYQSNGAPFLACDGAVAALRAALAQQDEPVETVREPVAWIHTDLDKPRVKFLEWSEDEPGYRGRWIKTPLYAAPPRCPNCSSLEAQNTELDRKLAELDQDEPVQEPVAWLIAQRDALLEALKDATKTIEHLGYPLAAIERARAAIKAVEETK